MLNRFFGVLVLVFGIATAAQAQLPANGDLIRGPSFRHVITVIFENASYNNVMKEPFFAKLAQGGALLSACVAETHPSQPNYIAMIAGDPMGVRDDFKHDIDGTHLGNLLEHRGLSWKVYAEGYPGNCFLGMTSGHYARRHVPFISFKNVQGDPNECAKIVPGADFSKDLTAGTLPTYALYVPDVNNDGHDTNVHYAAQWFEHTFGGLLANADFMKENLFIITFDEDDHSGQNRIYTVLYGANVIPGSTVTTPTNHYTLLKTLEDALFIGNLGRRDAGALPITGIWR